MINELDEAMKKGKGKNILAKIINDLISYTSTHFKTEEKYFDQFGFPKAASHKKEHSAFVQQVSDFKKGFNNGKLALSVDIMNFLSDWLKKHINGTDKEYSQFFNAKGLQ